MKMTNLNLKEILLVDQVLIYLKSIGIKIRLSNYPWRL